MALQKTEAGPDVSSNSKPGVDDECDSVHWQKIP
jgi:hypothetical protein